MSNWGGAARAAATSAGVATMVTAAEAVSWLSNGVPATPSMLMRRRGKVTAMRVGPWPFWWRRA